MARGIVPINTDVNLLLLLDKTATGKYCQAKVYNTSDTLVTTVNLTEETSKGDGVYQGVWTTPSGAGDFYVVYKVFTDSGYTTLDTTIPRHAEETFYVSGTTSLSSASPHSQSDTILNENTGLPIDGANVYIYTDSIYTQLVAAATTNTLGEYTINVDAAGTYYRKIIATGYLFENDSITVT